MDKTEFDDDEESTTRRSITMRRLCLVIIPAIAIVLLLTRLLLHAAWDSRHGANQSDCIGKIFYINANYNSLELNNTIQLPDPCHKPSEPPMHSWRAFFLAGINANFATQYNFAEPWNSERNLQVAKAFGNTFTCYNNSQTETPIFTNFTAIVDKSTGRSSLCKGGLDPSSKELYIVLIEIPHSDIIWTEPRDIDVSELKNLELGNEPDGLAVILSNGKTKRYSNDEILKSIKAK